MATDKTRVTVSLAADVAKDFEEMAKNYGLTKSGLLTVLVRDELERKAEK
ncbi:ribbon-helix-helix domain-containing protein [Lactococcus lactis]|nr:protein repA [Lactococcus lactis]WDA70158.1 protein repA [Lactococcus lactis]WDA70165.1 protein repA [Lactococcus lactis]